MIIALGSDHAGLELKKKIKNFLEIKDAKVRDFGTETGESCDYPDFAFSVAEAVRDKKADFGILVCYTGIGMSIAANKVKGIRAALPCSENSAALTKKHNDANVICFSSLTPYPEVEKMLEAYMGSSYEGGRHDKRISKISEYENRVFK